MIPWTLSIFKWIYEIGSYALWMIPIAFFPLVWYCQNKGKKWIFLLIVCAPLVLFAISFTSVYSGWHYRMELRDRYAADQRGWVNIDHMPPEVRAEYAAHDYHPRHRDIFGAFSFSFLLFPIFMLLGTPFYLFVRKVFFIFRARQQNR